MLNHRPYLENTDVTGISTIFSSILMDSTKDGIKQNHRIK